MATRATRDLSKALIKSYFVAAGVTVLENQPLWLSSALADNEVTNVPDLDGAGFPFGSIAIALESKSSGQPISVMMRCNAILAMRVAQSAVVRGHTAMVASDGTVTGGHVPPDLAVDAYGIPLQSGEIGDIIGVCVGFF